MGAAKQLSLIYSVKLYHPIKVKLSSGVNTSIGLFGQHSSTLPKEKTLLAFFKGAGRKFFVLDDGTKNLCPTDAGAIPFPFPKPQQKNIATFRRRETKTAVM